MSHDTFGTDAVLVPDLPEPITAYRAWKWNGEHLTGFGAVEWPHDDLIHAEHRCSTSAYAQIAFLVTTVNPCIETPSATGKDHAGYGCGIYGYRTMDQFVAHADYSGTTVWGQVELGGKVYEHTEGYRAEYGRVVALYRVPSAAPARAAAEVYGVPLLDLPFTQVELDELRKPKVVVSSASMRWTVDPWQIQQWIGPLTPTANQIASSSAAVAKAQDDIAAAAKAEQARRRLFGGRRG